MVLNTRVTIRWLALLAVVAWAMVAAGCNSDDDETVSDETSLMTTTVSDGTSTTGVETDPCGGLTEVGQLPDWTAKRQITSGSVVLCGFEDGVLVVGTSNGRANQAFVDDCSLFESTQIPSAVRPAPEDHWVCKMPGSDPGWETRLG
jgi:hypothetical protein